MAKIRILIADDHAVLRAGLRMLINAQADLEVVGEATNGHEALGLARKLLPDVITMDLNMPGNTIQTIERLRQECPQTRILVLTMHDDPAYLRAALAAGSAGYVTKSAADTELLIAIRTVFRGRSFVDSSLTDSLVQTALGNKPGGGPNGTQDSVSCLSHREREVLELLAQGHTNQQAADRLFLSVKTIETYRKRITDKLGLRSRADLVRYALEIGILGPGKFLLENKVP